MKKFLAYIVMAISLAPITVLAQAALENDIFDFKQGAFTFKTDYILNDFAVDISTYSGVIDRNNLTEIGFYKITPAGTTDITMMHTNNNGTITHNPDAPVTIAKDETIGIYVKTNGYIIKDHGKFKWVEGEKTYTTTDNAIPGAEAFKNNERPSEESNGMIVFSLASSVSIFGSPNLNTSKFK